MDIVYVLSMHCLMDGDEYKSVEVFNNLESAKKRMEVLYENEVKEFNERSLPDGFVQYKTKTSVQIFEKYRYDTNHSCIEINEVKVKN